MRSLLGSHETSLPFVFCELDNVSMDTLNIDKPVPIPLDVVNVDEATLSHFGHVTATYAILEDT